MLALVASLAACGGSSQAVPANAVAVVNGVPITAAQFKGFFEQAQAIAASQGQPKPQPGSPQYTQMRDQVVAYLVQAAEVQQQAEKEDVSVSQKDVDKFLADLAKSQFGGSMDKLEAGLKKQGLDMATARQEVLLNLLAQKIRTKVTANTQVTEKDAKDYFNSNSAQYPPTRSVEHILVKEKSLAEQIVRQLKNGASFAKLAKKYSKDPGSAAQGGKYTATKGREVPVYDDTAFALKTGALSGLVDATSQANGGYGWFIIKALGPVNEPKFSDVQASIQATLLQQKQQEAWQQWLDDLTKSYKGKVSYQGGYAPPTTTALPTTTG